MVFHWNLSDSSYPQVFKTLLIILVDLNSSVVCLVSILPLIFNFSVSFSSLCGSAPNWTFFFIWNFQNYFTILKLITAFFFYSCAWSCSLWNIVSISGKSWKYFLFFSSSDIIFLLIFFQLFSEVLIEILFIILYIIQTIFLVFVFKTTFWSIHSSAFFTYMLETWYFKYHWWPVQQFGLS